MIKMAQGSLTAWVAPRHVEQLEKEGWATVSEENKKSDEISAVLKPTKRSKNK